MNRGGGEGRLFVGGQFLSQLQHRYKNSLPMRRRSGLHIHRYEAALPIAGVADARNHVKKYGNNIRNHLIRHLALIIADKCINEILLSDRYGNVIKSGNTILLEIN